MRVAVIQSRNNGSGNEVVVRYLRHRIFWMSSRLDEENIKNKKLGMMFKFLAWEIS